MLGYSYFPSHLSEYPSQTLNNRAYSSYLASVQSLDSIEAKWGKLAADGFEAFGTLTDAAKSVVSTVSKSSAAEIAASYTRLWSDIILRPINSSAEPLVAKVASIYFEFIIISLIMPVLADFCDGSKFFELTDEMQEQIYTIKQKMHATYLRLNASLIKDQNGVKLTDIVLHKPADSASIESNLTKLLAQQRTNINELKSVVETLPADSKKVINTEIAKEVIKAGETLKSEPKVQTSPQIAAVQASFLLSSKVTEEDKIAIKEKMGAELKARKPRLPASKGGKKYRTKRKFNRKNKKTKRKSRR